MKKFEQSKIFDEMKKKAREAKKLMTEIEICQMERALLEREEKFYLLRMEELPDMLEVTKVGFLNFDYCDRYYTKVSIS